MFNFVLLTINLPMTKQVVEGLVVLNPCQVVANAEEWGRSQFQGIDLPWYIPTLWPSSLRQS